MCQGAPSKPLWAAPSHPLACWPLSSCIVPSHCRCHCCASVLLLLRWELPRCHGQGARRQVLGRVAASSRLMGVCTAFRPGRSLPFRALVRPCAPHGHIASPPCPAHLPNDIRTKHHLTCPSRSSQATATSLRLERTCTPCDAVSSRRPDPSTPQLRVSLTRCTAI
jgi:hypothetical protein